MAEVETMVDRRKAYMRAHGKVLIDVIVDTRTLEETPVVLVTTMIPRVEKKAVA